MSPSRNPGATVTPKKMSRRVSCGASTDDTATSAMKPRMVASHAFVSFRTVSCVATDRIVFGDDAGGETRGLRFSGELAQAPREATCAPRAAGSAASGQGRWRRGADAGEPVFVSEDAIGLGHRVVVERRDRLRADGRSAAALQPGRRGHEQGTERAGDLAIRGHREDKSMRMATRGASLSDVYRQ
jgi:hypothetical protein